jgi:uncharacterized protein YdeI (YjbR/CyaY-like superfamily)
VGLGEREHQQFPDRTALRSWLADNGQSSPGIWVRFHRVAGEGPALCYDDVVEEALCAGWVDSTVRRLDEGGTELLLTPRRPSSTWAGSNKARVTRLIDAGLMTPPGYRAIEVAKSNGSWEALDAVERGEVPDDLAAALDAVPAARRFFESLPPSARRMHVWFVVSAKRLDTRARRIAAVVAAAAEGRRSVG